MRQACCPPAEPKQLSAYSVTSEPRCTEIFLIAFAMFSTAMASSLANTYRVIERTQMLESTLKNAMSPRLSASALIVTPLPTKARVALCSGPLPW